MAKLCQVEAAEVVSAFDAALCERKAGHKGKHRETIHGTTEVFERPWRWPLRRIVHGYRLFTVVIEWDR